MLSYDANDRNEERMQQRRVLFARLRFVKMKLVKEISRDKDEVFVKVSAPSAILMHTAEQIGMEKKLRDGMYAEFTRCKLASALQSSESLIVTMLNAQRQDARFRE